MVRVELVGVTVRSGGTTVLDDVSLTVDSGSVLGVVGSSGSGKTTLLRAVSGLDPVTAGAVRFDGVDVTGRSPGERNVAVVFQVPALNPRRSVGRNISFPLEIRHEQIEEIRRRVGAESRALHIEQLLDASPRRLSAGEAQIVQIARAMVKQPALLLLDEPFAHVDSLRVAQLRREVILIQRGFAVTTLFATNDPYEAMAWPDRLVVLERGRIVQAGVPLDVYTRPRTAMAAHLTGEADVVDVEVEADADGSWLVRPGMRVRDWSPALRRHVGRRLQLVTRPEWLHIDPRGSVDARVERVDHDGAIALVACRVGGEVLRVRLDGGDEWGITGGDRLRLRLEQWVLLDPHDGSRLDLDT